MFRPEHTTFMAAASLADAAWAAGTAARQSNIKITTNPHKDTPGSIEDNCWRAAWQAEDHNLREARRA